MRRLSFILLSLLFCFNANGQRKFHKPDYPSIEKEIKDPNSPYSYEKLLTRYKGDDSTLTNLDYRHLYFGKMFSSDYSPYAASKYSDKLRAMLSKNSLNVNDYDRIIDLEKKVLEEQPFNIRDLNVLAYVYHQKGDASSEEKVSRKLSGIIHAIMETGDGKTEETAFHVIAVAHEYDLLNALGLRFGGQQSLTKKSCDYLKVEPNDQKIEGVYFDVSQILSAFEKKLK